MKTFFQLPEYLLILSALAAAYTPPFQFNPLFLAIAAVLILQIVFKNRFTGIAIGALFFTGNLFFLGALISEFSEFTVVNADALQLLLAGGTIWLISTCMSVLMIYKYSRLTTYPTRS